MKSFVCVGFPGVDAQIVGDEGRQLTFEDSSIAANYVLLAGVDVVVLDYDFKGG